MPGMVQPKMAVARMPRIVQCARKKAPKIDPDDPGEKKYQLNQKLLGMGELMFRAELMEMDYGDLPGMDRFRADVRDLQPDDKGFYQHLAGYEYQFDQTQALHQNSEVRRAEVEYQGASGKTRRVDIETIGGEYIECKGFAAGYDPEQSVKDKFLRQAQDYARSGRRVVYRFSNEPPQWARDILTDLSLPWQVVP